MMNPKNTIEEVKSKIENSHYQKFGIIIPEGFVMISKEKFERLKDFEVWKEWKHNPQILEDTEKNNLIC
jgi:hypothetical protein